MRKLFCIVAVLACVSTAGVVCARTWFLPDYQTGELHKKGYQDRGQSNAQNSVIRDNAFGCAAYGYLEAEEVDKPEDCEKNFQLPDGRFCYYNCCEKAPEDYTLYAIPSNASYSHFYDECEEKDKYRLDSCNAEYYLSVDECKACTWNGYTMESKSDSNATDYYSDTCGGKTKYAIKSCNSGYEINGNVCQACTWKGYTITEQEKSNIDYVKSFNSDTCGGITKYSINSCATCYHQSGNSCVKDSCTSVDCSNGSCSTDTCGCDVLYDCDSGYEMKSTYCKACTWNGYTLQEPSDSNGIYDSASCDGITKYSLSSCETCYYKSGNACYEEECASVDCSNATCKTDTCGCDYISSCDSCYSKSGNSCVKNSCTTTCPDNATCTYDSCGCRTGFTCDSCYSKSGSSCVKDSCTTSCPANATCTYDSCDCRTGFTCNDGYEKSGSSCVASCSCSMTSCPDNATCSYSSDGCNCVTSFTCDSCYSKSGSSCVEKTCSTTTCPSKSNCSTDSCGCKTFSGCKTGYYENSNDCGSVSHGSYSLTSPDSNGCGTCYLSCDSGYHICGGDCYADCNGYNEFDSCPSGAECTRQSNCCYTIDRCQDGYIDCYGNQCIPDDGINQCV